MRTRRVLLGALTFMLVLAPGVALAQSFNLDLGAGGTAGATSRLVQITALIAVLSLAPSLLVMVTAFTRIVIVLSLLRSALSTQSTPPNVVLIGLALFLTYLRDAAGARSGLDHRIAADEPGESAGDGRAASRRRAVPQVHDRQTCVPPT